MRFRVLIFVSAAVQCFVSLANAAERTVCFHFQFADDRYNCAGPAEAGARRPCDKGNYVDAVGHQIEFWDKNNNRDDEYIGTWYISAGGTQCATFEWENSGVSKGKINPDVYLRYTNVVNRTGYSNYIFIKAVDVDGNDRPVTSWRNGQPGDPDRYVALNCTAGSICYMFPSGSLVPTNDRASERAQRIMALDSGQHTVQILGEQMNRNLRLHFPGKSDCPTSCAPDRENFHINGSEGPDGILTSHEIGHTIQMQRFGQDNLNDDLGKNGNNGWSLDSDEYDSGATTEGFASYIGVVSWYEPNAFDTKPVGWGFDMDDGSPVRGTCSENRGIPVQVAKAFWDVDDWNDESGSGAASGTNDTLHYHTEDIIRGWDLFANGTGNRQKNESGSNGVNMRDYYENTKNWFTAPGYFETFIQHNCLQDQAN